MSVQQVLSLFESRGVKLRADGDDLGYRAPKGALTPELRQMLLEHKIELLEFLRAPSRLAKIRRSPAGEDVPAPLSAGQARLWFLDRLEPQTALYNVHFGLRIEGIVDLAALRASLDAVVARHAMLRARFPEIDGRPRVVVAPPAAWPLPVADLRKNADGLAELLRLRDEQASAPFDLARGPLMRTLLVSLDDDEHVLLFTQHHIVTDGSSLGILARDLLAFYLAFRDGTPPLLPELPVRYLDYAIWQEAELQGDAARKSEAWWKERLGGIPRLELPTSRTMATPSHAGDAFSFSLSPALTEALKGLGRNEGCTLYVTLLAGWAALLHRYSHQADFGIGTVTAGRDHSELSDLVGFFVNTLVLRCDLSGDPDVKTLMWRLRETVAGALQHQDLPFDRIVSAAGADRGQDLNPLFRAGFGLENVPLPGLSAGGTTWTPEVLKADGGVHGIAKFDLGLTLAEQDGALWGTLEYATDLFDAGAIARMATHYRIILEGMVAAKGQRVTELPLLAVEERHRVVTEWNEPAADASLTGCIHELFEAQVEKTPDATAVVCDGESLTYRDLNARANRLAHHLRSLGVGPDQLVGLCAERGLPMMVGILGVLKSGGAYVPLDPEYPRARLEYMLSDSKAVVLLAQAQLRDRFAQSGTSWVDLDRDWPMPDSNPLPATDPSNLAYCFYTSGSTGKPKGVALMHSNTVSFLSWAHAAYDREELARVLFSTSMCFDLSIFEMFAPLTTGGAIVLVKNALSLIEDRVSFAPTLVNTVPSAAQALLHANAFPQGMRVLNLCGEALRPDLAEGLLRALPDAKVINLYGPTEATTYSTVWQVQDGPVSIGRPLSNTRIYLLDEKRQPVPIGVAGEIYIGGSGIARGYLNRPELSEERFIPDPFGPNGSKMYRTGDLARYLSDGSIEFLGRVDHQVKIRGYRIELGEIESALGRCEGVGEAAVIAREDIPGDKRLVAYLVEKGARPDDAEVRSRLSESLPEPMVPSVFVWLPELPLTPNGKIDRKALPAPQAPQAATKPSDAVRTPVEEVLAGVWCEVLKREHVELHDDFFALGGHSLMATQVVSRLRALFDVELPIRAMFEARTIAGLAKRVEAARGMGPLLAAARLERQPRPDELPLSFAQERLWFLERLTPGRSVYNVPVALRLRGALDVAALERSIGEIVRRHEVLRTVFAGTDGRARQVIIAQPEVSLSRMSLDAPRHSEREAALLRLAREEADRPFDLTQGPLLRAQLVAVAPDDHALFLTIHHAVTDGWSLGVLMRELKALYSAFAAGKPSPLSELKLQYADYILWQRQTLNGEALETELSYWKKQLTGAPPALDLPTDHPRPAEQSFRGGAVPLTLPASLVGAVESLSRREGVTPFMTLLASWQILLQRYSGQDDLVIGTPIAGRTEAQTEDLIGLFVNTLALRTDLSGEPTVSELLGRVREVTLDAYAHQTLPFEQLLDQTAASRDMSRSNIVQVMFVLQNAPLSLDRMGEVVPEAMRVEQTTSKFDLALSLQQGAEGLEGYIEYASDLFNRATIERMAGHYLTLLEALIAAPEARISTLPILGDAERRELLGHRQDAETFAHDRLVHQLFEAQAVRRPQAVAVVCDGERLTYGELNERANQLAHYLETLGVGPEVPVGLCLDRSLEMVVAILGVLKASGTYVPMEPSNPAERILFMLADTKAPVLLTQARHREKASGYRGRTICLDADWGVISEGSTDNPATRARSESCAYVIYTSGSTGNPKGVRVSHANVARLFSATDAWFHFDDRDGWTLFHSYAFDFSVWEIWGALLYGGRLVVVPYEVSRAPDAFHRLLAREAVTVLNQTPSAFRLLVAADASSRETLSLRLVVFGGEAVDLPSLKPWFARHGDAWPQLVNMYGITETTVHVTYRPLRAADVEEGSSSPIGCPIPDLQVHVLDGHGQLVPVGVPGELYVGGAGVALGYLSRLELTAERFIEDPFRAGGRLYKTGDLGRRLASGGLEYLGRIDHQVKIRGFRIELGEIEGVLSQHPAIAEAVVIARKDHPGEQRLVAYYVPREGRAPSTGDLRSHLKVKLPEYMIPAAFVELSSMPLTTNGKIDRKALPAPSEARPELQRAYAAPRTAEEDLLVGIWADVLKVSRVGIDDRFFELGGDSILSLQVIARAQRSGLSLSVRSIFQHPTIRELAQIAAAGGEEREPEAALAPFALLSLPDRARLPEDIEDAYPLAMLQAGMVFHSQSVPDASMYHDITSYHLRAEIDPQVMRAALDRMTAAHPILRTSFDFTTLTEPMQLVHKTASILLACGDWSGLSLAAQDEALTALFEEDKRRGFDFAQAPLLRMYLHRRSATTVQVTLVNHHAILDGWSVAAFMTELMRRLTSRKDLEAPRSLYREFVAMEQVALSSADTRRFWEEKLEGAVPATLPHGYADARDVDRRMVELELAEEETKALKKLALEASVPIKSVLLSAHLRVLAVLSGASDIVTGLVSNGRPEGDDADRSLGLYLNTLPFRQRIPEGSWLDFLRETFSAERDVLSHRRYPLAEMQRHRTAPLFETAFNFIHFHVYNQLDEADRSRVLGWRTFELTNFKLLASFNLDLRSARLNVMLSFSMPELSDAQIEEIKDLYRWTLIDMARDPSAHVLSTSGLSQAQRQRQLVEWNASSLPVPHSCIHELFEAQVEKTPDAAAVVCNGESLTYRELNARANRLAHHLRSLGVGPEKLVGVCVERSLSMMVGILSVLKAGGAYVPLDPEYPRARLEHMLDDSGATVLLTQARLADRLPPTQAQLVDLDQDWLDQDGPRPDSNPEPRVQPSNLAYCIYTSGSTGKPKGVALLHSNAAAFLAWAWKAFDREDTARVLFSTSICFDLSIFEMFVPLSSGGTVVVVKNALALMDGEASPSPTLINTVPSAAQALLQANAFPPGLRVLNLAGEPLRRELADGLLQALPETRLYNLYGPTEYTTYSTYCQVSAEGKITIGRPLANTQVYLLDRHCQPVPVGVAGEIYIAGLGLARGYLNRPELTEEKFVADPFAGPGNRMYRTGDLGRHTPEGEIEFLGRIDHQVKIRGYRIELGEIESALARCEGVGEAVVIAREDVPGDKRLVAYLVEKGARSSEAEIRSQLLQSLPDPMVPSTFVWLRALPLNLNGKIDRKALPAPEAPKAHAKSLDAPRAPVEEVIAGLWCEVLGVEHVGLHDDFFALGGHSLTATRVVSRLRAVFDVEMPIRALFEAPTIATLASRVQDSLGGGAPKALPLKAEVRPGRLPLSFAQERLWFLDRIQPNTSLYNIPVAQRLRGTVDVAALERSLGEVVRRHEALRTIFVESSGRARQKIVATEVIRLPVLAIEEAELDARLGDEAARPFDLARGPLFRAKLFSLAPQDHVLFLAMHHVVSDGWSLGVLTRELSALYEAFRSGRPSPLPELEIQSPDYALWQRRSLTGEVLEAQLAYWKKALAGAPPALALPTDHPRPTTPSHTGSTVDVSLPAELTHDLVALSRREGVTLFMTLLAAWQVLLQRYTGQDDIVVGTPIAGRTEEETEELIGLFLNTLALRTELSGEPTVRELLKRVREVTLGAYAHQALPFEKLVAHLTQVRDMSRSPIFQTMFVLQNAPRPELALGDVEISPVPVRQTTAKFELTLSLEESGGALQGEIEYRSDLFDRETIERMTGHLRTLLEAMVAAPHRPVSALALLTQGERHRMLTEWNEAAEEGPQSQCIHELFEAQVEKTPDAIAVVCEGVSLTYRELNGRANQLAHHLRSLGVGPEKMVGICAERGLPMVVAIVGVLKSGGAYVPLDPAYPRARLEHMLSDSKAVVLLTHAELDDRVPATAAIRTDLDGEFDAPDSNPLPIAKPSNLAYCIYTSGSTGKPKGVALMHSNAVSFLAWARATYDREDLARVLFGTSISFDLSIFELFAPLSTGGTVVLVKNALSLIEDRVTPAPTLVNTVPSAAQALLQANAFPQGLRVLNMAGEVLRPELAEGLLQALPEARVMNLYGPTETTTYSTLWQVRAAPISIGRPMSNTRIYLLDGRREPVPVGVTGEVYIGGAGVARGYLNNAELTEEKFLPDPFGREGGRMYRTGDLARYRPDGTMEFVGRIDHQVKIRGYRVELGEIETALAACAGVGQAVAIAREDAPGDNRLVAYLVEDGVRPGEDELGRRLSETLPDYMVPSAFVWLPSLPLTLNGKLDRKALPAPEGQAPSGEGESPSPFGAVEIELMHIWEDLLGAKALGTRSDFFSLGGHSLSAIRLLKKVEDHFGQGVSLASFFRTPTVAGLAEQLRKEAVKRTWSPLVPIQPKGRGRPFFCVHPGLGSVAGYHEIARHLGEERPFYALASIGLERDQVPDRTIEEMAARYVSALRAVQPEGPYLIGGHSFGGLVAFEMAQKLVENGYRVGLVALLDTSAPGGAPSPFENVAGERNVPAFLLLLRELGVHVKPEALLDLSPREQIERALQLLVDGGHVPASFDREEMRRMVGWRTDIVPSACERYAPRVYPGSVTLLRAEEKISAVSGFEMPGAEAFERWRDLTTQSLAVLDVPGDHFSMLKPPNVQVLAERLRRCLEEAEQPRGRRGPPPAAETDAVTPP